MRNEQAGKQKNTELTDKKKKAEKSLKKVLTKGAGACIIHQVAASKTHHKAP